jgi:hypothetical protein
MPQSEPGHDPVELFVDPADRFPGRAAGRRPGLVKLGVHRFLDVISSTDTRLVTGTHGRLTDEPADGLLVIGSAPQRLPEGPVAATEFKALTAAHVFGR